MLIKTTRHISKLLLGVSVLAIGIAYGGMANAYPNFGATATSDDAAYIEGSENSWFEPYQLAANGQGGGEPGTGSPGGGHADGGHDDGHDDGHEGGGRPADRGHDDGHDDGGHEDDGVVVTHDDGEESDGRGPNYGQPSGSQGGKPVWAQEGLPEIELGRMNVARAPDHVIDRAYDEALANFNAEIADFYSMTLEEAILALTTDFDNQTFYDAPLQNLALLRDALDGASVLNTLPGVTNDNETLLALFLGAASDKTVPIEPETAYAVALLLGYELTEADAIALAADAEAVREAILAGHG